MLYLYADHYGQVTCLFDSCEFRDIPESGIWGVLDIDVLVGYVRLNNVKFYNNGYEGSLDDELYFSFLSFHEATTAVVEVLNSHVYNNLYGISGIYVDADSATLIVRNTVFENNTMEDFGQLYGYGYSDITVEIENSTFTDIHSTTTYTTEVYVEFDGNVLIRDSSFIGGSGKGDEICPHLILFRNDSF